MDRPQIGRSRSTLWFEGYNAGCMQFLQSYEPDHRDGKPLVVGLAGGTGSGKSTIKDVILEQLSQVDTCASLSPTHIKLHTQKCSPLSQKIHARVVSLSFSPSFSFSLSLDLAFALAPSHMWISPNIHGLVNYLPHTHTHTRMATTPCNTNMGPYPPSHGL